MTAAPSPDLTQAFFDTCPEMFCILDREGRVLRANRAWQAVLGPAAPDAPGESLVVRVPEADRKVFASRLREPQATTWRGVFRNAAGEALRVSLTWSPDERGFLHVMARRVASDAPDAQLDQRARALVRHTDLAIIDSAVDGEILGWNPAAEDLFGHTAEEAVGRKLIDLLNVPGDPVDTRASAEALLHHGTIREAGRNRTKDGRIILCEWQVVLLRDEAGAPYGVTAVVQDITTHVEQHRALEERTRMLEVMLENVPLCLWAYDREGTLSLSKGSALRAFGLVDDQLVGKNVFQLYADQVEMNKAMREGLDGVTSVVRVSVHGRDWESHIIPIRDEAGAVTGVLGLGLDTTERARLERELREHIGLLEEQRSTIRALSTPVLQVWDQILALPIIGHMDAGRAEAVMDALLAEIVRTQSRYAILDVTGVEIMDTTTVHHLARLLRAVALLGAEGLLTGVGPAVARSLVELGVDLGQVPTAANLRAGLQRCMRGLDGQGRRRGRGTDLTG